MQFVRNGSCARLCFVNLKEGELFPSTVACSYVHVGMKFFVDCYKLCEQRRRTQKKKEEKKKMKVKTLVNRGQWRQAT